MNQELNADLTQLMLTEKDPFFSLLLPDDVDEDRPEAINVLFKRWREWLNVDHIVLFVEAATLGGFSGDRAMMMCANKGQT